MKIKKINQSAGLVASVVDNLKSTTPTNALSSNMGRVLKNFIDETNAHLTITNTNVYVETVLFEGSSSTAAGSSITLSESKDNFDELEITYIDGTNPSEKVKISASNTDYYLTSNSWKFSGSDYTVYKRVRLISLSEKTITIKTQANQHSDISNGAIGGTTNGTISIKKVIGIKKGVTYDS